MINCYELVPSYIMRRFRSEIRAKVINGKIKTYRGLLNYSCDTVGASMLNRGKVNYHDLDEATALVNCDKIMRSIRKHCEESNRMSRIERAVMADLGEKKDRDDVSKSFVLYILIIKVVITILIEWYWHTHKSGQKLVRAKANPLFPEPEGEEDENSL